VRDVIDPLGPFILILVSRPARWSSDNLEAALAEARKGWLERLLEAVRKR
jgi:hypothetical protein